MRSLYPRTQSQCLRLLKKSVYRCSILILVPLLFVMVYQCLSFFLKNPTYFSTTIVLQKEVDFPSVTVCPEPHGYKLAVLNVSAGFARVYCTVHSMTSIQFNSVTLLLSKAHGIANVDNYNNGNKVGNMSWGSNQTGVTGWDLFEQATLKPEEMFKEVYFRFFKSGKDGRYNKKYRQVSGSLPWVRELRHRAKGRCYTITPEPWMKELGLYYWKLTL